MKKTIIAILSTIILALSFVTLPSFAAKEGEPCTCADGKPGVVTIDTAILSGCDCSNSGGDNAVLNIIKLVVDIMSIGVGILGVIGITIVGVQYLTAGGNEEKTRKAKRRMFEIVIGLVAYVLIYALLKWLMPGMPN